MNKKLILTGLVIISILFVYFISAQSDVCGDGVISGSEQCDDGNTAVGDGCSSTCQIETGYTCSGQPSVCSLVPLFTNLVSVQNGTLNTNNLIVSNNVGIGTASPGGALHVDKSTDTSSSYAIKAEKGDNNGAYQYTVAGFLGGNSGNYETFGSLGAVVGGTKIGVFGKGTDNTGVRVGYAGYFLGDLYTSGNVGIGTSMSEQLLHISGSGTNIPLLLTRTDTSDFFTVRVGSIADRIRFSDSNNLIFETTPYANRGDPTGTELMVIQPNGNVGIGTATPSAKLSIEGNNNLGYPGSTLSLTYDNTLYPGRARVFAGTYGTLVLTANLDSFKSYIDTNGFRLDDPTKPGWDIGLSPDSDYFSIIRFPPKVGEFSGSVGEKLLYIGGSGNVEIKSLAGTGNAVICADSTGRLYRATGTTC